MEIQYASAHKWTKELNNAAWDGFGKNSIARIKSTQKKILEYDIECKISEINQEFLQQFLPMYEQRINEKTNPRVFDITERITQAKRPYYSLSLHEDGEFLGGTIFSLPNQERCSIAYRTYKNNWHCAKLQAKPSLYTEYILCEHALSLGIKTIIHGKDRNPYGLNSNIGVATFKLSVGCRPQKSKVFEVSTITTKSIDTDALIFESPGDQPNITKGYLVTSKATESKWAQVTKYPHLIEIETLYRD